MEDLVAVKAGGQVRLRPLPIVESNEMPATWIKTNRTREQTFRAVDQIRCKFHFPPAQLDKIRVRRQGLFFTRNRCDSRWMV